MVCMWVNLFYLSLGKINGWKQSVYMDTPAYTIHVTVCVLTFCHLGLQQ